MAVGKAGFIDVWNAARARLRKGPLPPLLVLAGDAPFVKERLVEAAAHGHGGEVEVFAARPGERDADACRRLLDDWRTATLFGGARLIVARDADGLLKGQGLQGLQEVLEGSPPPHRLLLTLEALDGRSRLAKRLKTDDGLVGLPPLRDAPPPWHEGAPFLQTDLNAWVVEEARLQGLAMDLKAADALTRRTGNEPGRIAQKLAQLAVLMGQAGALTPQDVAAHVPYTSTRLLGLFEDALFAGRAAEALTLADRMLHQGVLDPFGRLVGGALAADTVLRQLVANLARLLEVHERLDGRLQAALRAKPWQRRAEDAAALDEVLGKGGRRVFVERDLKRSNPGSTRSALRVAVAALRALRDGRGASFHAETVRLCRAFGGARRKAAAW